MRSIARLLFGPEGDRIADLFAPGEHDEREHGQPSQASRRVVPDHARQVSYPQSAPA